MNEEIKPFWKLALDRWIWVATSSAIAGILALLGLFGVPIPPWVAWLLVVVGIVVAIWLAGQSTHNERKNLRERLKPKIRIADETEIEETQKSRRIRVLSESEVGCKFGAEIVRITPGILHFPLPFALRLIPETGQRVEFLPARSSRTVDVVMHGRDFDQLAIFDDGRLAFLGIGDTGILVKKKAEEECRIRICAYSELEGARDEKEFIVETSEEGAPALSLAPPSKPLVSDSESEKMPAFLIRLCSVCNSAERVLKAGWAAMRKPPTLK